MLLGNFFTIHDKAVAGNLTTATLGLNARHQIFEGHFPGQPVVPGVCMLQMIKEILELQVEKKLILKKSDHLKFLAIINPIEHPFVVIEFALQEDENADILVTGKILKEQTVFLKFKVLFSISK